MWLLIVFILVWAFAPGPLTVVTLHETRKHGFRAGVAISAGAGLTCALMVVAALAVHNAGLTGIFEADGMNLIERVGALGIIGVGVFSGYKGLRPAAEEVAVSTNTKEQIGFLKGFMMMATYIPQALVFYGLIVPKTVDPQLLITVILGLGVLKTVLVFGWHTGVAFVTTRAQGWIDNNRMGKPLELSSACLIIVLGVKILV